MKLQPKTVDAYISSFPLDVQEKLIALRNLIINNTVDVTETISYGIPAYKTHGKPLVYFAAYSKHIGFYGTPHVHEAFADALKGYKQGKGSVQFPLESPLPVDLITHIIKFRENENSTFRNKK